MKYLMSAICLIFTLQAVSQGCSDAGFCTANALKPGMHREASVYKNHFRAGAGVGKADFDINIFTSFIEYGRQLSDKMSFDIRLTAMSQSGNDISKFGIGDVYLNTSYSLKENINLMAGLKVPLNSADRIHNLLPLPMDYQSSLGTFDLIVGASGMVSGISLSLALQQPLSKNENTFNPALYPAASPLREFPNTRNFVRSGDILLRAAYPIALGDKFKVTPGLLPIYHLSNDKYTDTDGVQKEITGSQGLTLNTNVFLDYGFSDKSFIQLGLGMPLVVRETRPDGLTRAFVASLEFTRRF